MKCIFIPKETSFKTSLSFCNTEKTQFCPKQLELVGIELLLANKTFLWKVEKGILSFFPSSTYCFKSDKSIYSESRGKRKYVCEIRDVPLCYKCIFC